MTSAPAKILVIEDDPAIRRLLRTTLSVNDYIVEESASGAEGLRLLAHVKPDVIVLDLGLPDMEGQDVIAKIRARGPTPILVLSSRDDEPGKVAALDGGADDYVTKPFGMDEFLARIRAALRHAVQSAGGKPLFEAEGLTVDLVYRRALRDGFELKLTPKEWDLLQQLVTHAGKVLTHKHLLNAVWPGEAQADAQYLRVYVRQLRQKIEADPDQPKLLLTEPGVGYRLRA